MSKNRVLKGGAALLFALLILLGAAHPASAKIPYFSVEIEPREPVAGRDATVTVRFYGDPGHARPSDFRMGSMDNLLSVHRAGESPREGIRITLLDEGGILRARVVFDEPGRWVITAFPDLVRRQGGREIPAPGYPDTIELNVLPSATRAARSGEAGTTLPLAAAAVGFLLLAGLLLLRRRSAPDSSAA